MKKNLMKVSCLAGLLLIAGANQTIVNAGNSKNNNKNAEKDLVINGTGKSVALSIDSKALNGKEVTVKASKGFEVSPMNFTANGKAKLNVKLVSSKDSTFGELVFRCGDTRKYIKVVGVGTPLPTKSLSAKTLASGKKKQFEQAFKPGKNGYTLEFRLKSMEEGELFNPYFVDANGYGFLSNIAFNKVSLQNSYEKEISNPATEGKEGGGKFYNNDGLSHTYRIAVTPDNRAFIYRDGVLLKVTRTDDYAPRNFFTAGKGEVKENLLKNGDFEGEFDLSEDKERAEGVEGWDVAIGDRWNSEQKVQKLGLDNQLDVDNQVFWIRPYKWREGWSDGILEQIVDIVPGETYTLTALLKGGTSSKQAKNFGQLQIREVQERSKSVTTPIVSNEWEEYSLDYTPSKECKQIAVQITNGRGGWGNDITPVYADNVKLTGKGCTYSPKFGFLNQGTDVEYFAIDESGAYAPETPEINVAF